MDGQTDGQVDFVALDIFGTVISAIQTPFFGGGKLQYDFSGAAFLLVTVIIIIHSRQLNFSGAPFGEKTCMTGGGGGQGKFSPFKRAH